MYRLKFLAVLIIIINISGCATKINTEQAEEIMDLALNYLTENYDDHFSARGYVDSNWMYEYETVTFVSEKFSEVVEVRIFNEDDHYFFTDNYFKLRMQKDAEEYMNKLASSCNVNSEVRIRFISSQLPKTLENNATFSDYVATGECNMEVYFISDSAYSENEVTSILKELCSAKIMGVITFATCKDSKLLSQCGISDIINKKYDSILSWQRYTIDNGFSINLTQKWF